MTKTQSTRADNDQKPDPMKFIGGTLMVRLQVVLDAIASVSARYPTDIFPEDGESLDCKSARMARITCRNICREIEERINEPV